MDSGVLLWSGVFVLLSLTGVDTSSHSLIHKRVGDSVTLPSGLQSGKTFDKVVWRYEDKRIATYTNNEPRYPDSQFSGRLEISGGDLSLTVRDLTLQDSGVFRVLSDDGIQQEDTEISLQVQARPQPVLSVSPPWLNPGDSVTLSCEVGDSSTGWRFSFYRAVPYTDGLPSLSDESYSLELLSDSNGTTGNSYTLTSAGPSLTGRYVCRGGRGEADYHTDFSKPQLLWSGDRQSSVSLSLSPSQSQHLSSESLSLSCESKRNSTGWKLKMFSDREKPGCPSIQGSLKGSICTIRSLQTQNSGVYWCESISAEFSNAVNITVHDGPVILESPVHPVTEGDPLTLRCKHRTPPSNPKVDFYKDDELIRNATSGEMSIAAVSQSDRGLYKCQYSDSGESPESWLTVRGAVHGRVPVSLVVGLVVTGALLVIIILLLLGYRKVKGSRSGQSSMSPQPQSTNQDPLQHDQDSVAGPSDVTYSQIELKNLGKPRRQTGKPAEDDSTVATGATPGGAAGGEDVTYAQVDLKKKKKKRKPAEDDTVYSTVATGATPGGAAGGEDVTYAQVDLKKKKKKSPSTLAEPGPVPLK